MMVACGLAFHVLCEWGLAVSRSQPAFHGCAPAATLAAIRLKSACVCRRPGCTSVAAGVAAAAEADETAYGRPASIAPPMPMAAAPLSTPRRLSCRGSCSLDMIVLLEGLL